MMKGGAGGSDTNNNNINNSELLPKQEEDQTTTSWGTWEELLLACAVKRHGVNDWESVASEVQAKTSLPQLLTTASNCKLKYHDLRRRFNSPYSSQHQNDDVPPTPPHDNNHHDVDPNSNNNHNNIPWLDDLRKLRVAQLRQELHRYDVSIVSLQLKVKRLEEEREESLKDDDEAKPDLEEDDSKGHRSENDKTTEHEPDRSRPDLENQSVNGSNSTCSKSHDNKHVRVGSEPELDPAPGPAGLVEPSKGTGHSESDKGSSETVAKNRKGGGGGESAGETRESSEEQSSASLTRKWKAKRRRRMEVPAGEEQQRNQEESLLVKSQPLVGVLQMIRAHERSSLFERRLPTQESDEYKSMVQQHVDLGTIRTKLHNDSYSSCALSFYRDLLLLFNNAVVFFPKSSPESLTAHQLRRLVLNEMKKNNLITRPNVNDPSPQDSLPPLLPAPITRRSQQPKLPDQLERSDSLLAKHKSTAPIIVCRKRSSISSKPSAAASSFAETHKAEQGDEKKKAATFDLKPPAINNNKASSSDDVAEEHGVSLVSKNAAAKTKDNRFTTGTRSSRRTGSTNQENKNGTASTKKQGLSPASLKATPKADKKAKAEAAALDKKRSAAADFLKRIKRNLPADTLKSSGTRTAGEQKRRRGGGGKVDKVKERLLRQSGGDKKKQAKEESPSKRSVGRPSKKAAAEAANLASPKRSRENGGKKEASRRPRKQSRK